MRSSGLALLLILCVSGLFVACAAPLDSASEPKAGGRRTGSLKGLESLEGTINERIFLPDSEQLQLWSYLEADYRESGLAALLGAFTEVTGYSVQVRAVPNAVNSLLWQIVSGGAAADLAAKACSAENVALRPDFYAPAHRLCRSTAQAGGEAEAMEALWMALARYDAPESEMRLWMAEEMAGDGIVVTSEGQERLSALLQSILMNPYFMLEH